MPKNFSTLSRLSAAQKETADTKRVEELFDWKPTFLYSQFRQGNIKGYLIPLAPGRRGKRLWDVQSIRTFISRCEAPAFQISPNAHRPRKIQKTATV
jgi:hypothetical protein